ncbi:MAG: response regulator [Chloroflexota bacterium]|nr:MAG: response regulator [Chloroflexota bacterium]
MPGPRVLIADDSSLARAVIADALTTAGFAIVGEVSDGIAAVAAFQALRPDAVTMDLTMPGVDGITALRGILEADSSARVIIVSAAGQESSVIRALRAGAAGFVLKPFEPSQLVDALRKSGLDVSRGAVSDEGRRTFLHQAQRRIEMLAEDIREIRETGGDSGAFDVVRRRASSVARTANAAGEPSLAVLAQAIERAAMAIVDLGTVSDDLVRLLDESVVALHRLLIGVARGDGERLLSEAFRARIDGAIDQLRAHAGRPIGARRALIVDVDPFSRRVLQGFLRREGFAVATLQAVDEIDDVEPPSIVVVDGSPARFDAPTAIRQLRASEVTARAAIIYLTPRAELSERLAAFKAGADDVIQTPFDPEELLARVTAMVRRSERRPAPALESESANEPMPGGE